MKSVRTTQFRQRYAALPAEIQRKADEAYQLFRLDSSHPSLHFKKVDDGDPEVWSVRIDHRYRALGLRSTDRIAWVWIGTYREYEERT